MSLNNLVRMEESAKALDSKRAIAESARHTVSQIKNSSLSSQLLNSQSQLNGYGHGKYASNDLAKKIIAEVMDEMSPEVMAIAELRLDAEIRSMAMDAAQKRAVIHASILPSELVTGKAEVKS